MRVSSKFIGILVFLLFGAFSTSLLAQTNYVVSIQVDANAAEPDQDGYFDVTLSQPVGAFWSVVVCVDVIGGTATEDVDYEPIEDVVYESCAPDEYEVVIDEFEDNASIPLYVLDDPDTEGTETVTVAITESWVSCECSETTSIGNGTATATIEDDDNNAEFMAYKSFSDGNPTSVDINLVCTDADIDQASQPASQGNPALFSLTNVGSSNTCTATEGAAPEGYSGYSYGCTGESVLPGDTQYCSFDNYYDGVTVEVRSVSAATEPDQDGAFELVLSGNPPWGGLEVQVGIGGTATPDSDYKAIGETLSVPYGTTRHPVPVEVIDDEIKEEAETVTLNVLPEETEYCGEYSQGLQAGSGGPAKEEITIPYGCDSYYVPGQSTEASVKIWDDDKPLVMVESSGDAAEPDVAGGFLLMLDEPAPEGGLNVQMLIEGSALAGEDYQPITVPVFVPAGVTEHEVAVVPVDDETAEPTETVSIRLSPTNDYRIGVGNEIRATVNITDDDDDDVTPPVIAHISVNPTSGLMTDEDGATAQFEIVLTAEPAEPIGVVVESSDTTEGTVSPMSVSFDSNNWNQPQTVTITGQDDDEEDGDQAYKVMLTASEAYAGNPPPDVSVTNKDTTEPPPDPASAQFTAAVYMVKEVDGVAQVTVKRVGNPDVPLTAVVSTEDSSDGTTATPGEDYTPVSGEEVSWAAGDTDDKVVEITVFENVDTVTGENETVALNLAVDDTEDQKASLEIESDAADDIVGGITDDELPPNQQEIVHVILDSCPKGGNAPDFQGLCTAMVLSAADGNPVSTALKQATPDDAAAVRSSGMQTTNVQVTAVDGRLGTLRGGGGAGFSASGFSMNYGDLAVSGSLLKSFVSAFDQQNPEILQHNANQGDDNFVDGFGRWGAWISGRVVFGEKDPTTNQIEYDFDTAGITFGLDYRFTDELVAGVAVGYANTDAKLGRGDGDLDSTAYSLSLYGTWFKSDRFYLGGSLGYGSSEYDHQRNVRYTIDRPDQLPVDLPDSVFDVDQTLAADYDGDQFSASLSGGWDFNKDGWTFGPTFRVSYVDVSVDAYDEFLLSSNMASDLASSGWAVHIDDQSYTSLQPSIGFEFTKAVSASWGVFIPQGYVEVVSELEDGGELITGQFIGDRNNARFALETDDFEETFARAGLGFGLILKNNKSAYLMVDGDFGRDLLSTYYINAGFRWQF